MITVTKRVFFSRGERGRGRIETKAPPSQQASAGRVPRVTRVMALALHFDGLLRDGVVSDTIVLARLAKVTQPRITQVMSLLHLAPDIQEEILFLPLVTAGRDPIHEKPLRRVAAKVDFGVQRRLWKQLKEQAASPAT